MVENPAAAVHLMSPEEVHHLLRRARIWCGVISAFVVDLPGGVHREVDSIALPGASTPKVGLQRVKGRKVPAFPPGKEEKFRRPGTFLCSVVGE